jgi:urease accessory protein
MSVAVFPSDRACPETVAQPLERARGALVLGFRRRGDATVLARLRQEGCLKARLPLVEDAAWAEAVLLNSSGGVAQGDLLRQAITVGAGARATVAMQAAERIYRARPGGAPAEIRTHVVAAPESWVEWMPQETILFDGAALDRVLEIELAPTASCLVVEMLVFGRAAMGESVRSGSLHDRIVLHRDGRMVLRDAIRMAGNMDATLGRAASGAGARAVATIILAAPDSERRLDALRAALGPMLPDAGCSAWDGLLVARLAARDGALLRRAVVAGLAVLRAGRPLPRVWYC